MVCNFYGVATNYIIHGYYSTVASTGANNIKASKIGKFFIKFKDGIIYELFPPQVMVKGITIGKRTYNYKCDEQYFKMYSSMLVNPQWTKILMLHCHL